MAHSSIAARRRCLVLCGNFFAARSFQGAEYRFTKDNRWKNKAFPWLPLLLILLLWNLIPLSPLYAQSPLPTEPINPHVYLPLVASNATPIPPAAPISTPSPTPTSTPSPTPTATATVAPTAATACQLDSNEQELADLLRNDPQQQRSALFCNTILTRVARERAQDMAERDYFGHTNPDGYGPNYLVEQAGYVLPDFYDQSPAGNNIESLAGGFGNANDVWQAWLGSASHRVHVLGEHPFFAEQIDYGVGYFYDAESSRKHYWVLLTARSGP